MNENEMSSWLNFKYGGDDDIFRTGLFGESRSIRRQYQPKSLRI